jgi:hypothetical protein
LLKDIAALAELILPKSVILPQSLPLKVTLSVPMSNIFVPFPNCMEQFWPFAEVFIEFIASCMVLNWPALPLVMAKDNPLDETV